MEATVKIANLKGQVREERKDGNVDGVVIVLLLSQVSCVCAGLRPCGDVWLCIHLSYFAGACWENWDSAGTGTTKHTLFKRSSGIVGGQFTCQRMLQLTTQLCQLCHKLFQTIQRKNRFMNESLPVNSNSTNDVY